MQGLAGLLGYETPFTDFVGDRRNTLMGLAGGMMGHRGSFASGLGKGFQYAQQGRQVDLAENQMAQQEEARRQEIAQAQEQRNAALAYLQKNRPDLFEKVQAGMPVAEAWKILNAPAGSGSQENWYGNIIYTQDENGNVIPGQYSNQGNFRPLDLGDGNSIASPVDKVDAGTHYELLNRQTGERVGTIPKDNYQPAYDAALGSAEAKAGVERASQAPKEIASAEQTIGLIDGMIGNPEKGIKAHPGLDETFGNVMGIPQQWTGAIPGTNKADFIARLEQLQGKAFLEAYAMLKGGGQITEIEGVKAENAMARMQRAQSKEAFVAAMKEFRDAVESGLRKLQAAQGGGQPNIASTGITWSIE